MSQVSDAYSKTTRPPKKQKTCFVFVHTFKFEQQQAEEQAEQQAEQQQAEEEAEEQQ